MVSFLMVSFSVPFFANLCAPGDPSAIEVGRISITCTVDVLLVPSVFTAVDVVQARYSGMAFGVYTGCTRTPERGVGVYTREVIDIAR